MATSGRLGTLTVDLVGNTSSFQADMGRAAAHASRSLKSIEGSVGRLSSTVASIKSVAAGVGASLGAALAVDRIVELNRESARLTASLVTVTRSQQAAAGQFAALQQLASDLGQSTDVLTEAYVGLANRGIKPSEERLRAFGNIAASIPGKNVGQVVEAVADALSGEFERLQEFGIKAVNQGDKVALTFQGVTRQIENSSASIVSALEDIGKTQFAGALENQAASLDGSFNRAGVAVSRLASTIGASGLNAAIQTVVDLFREGVEWSDKFIQSFWRTANITNSGAAQMQVQSLEARLKGLRDSRRATADEVAAFTERGTKNPFLERSLDEFDTDMLRVTQQLSEARAKFQELNNIKLGDGLQDNSGGASAQQLAAGQKIIDATRTAQEKYNEAVREAKALRDAGAISEDVYNRAVAQAKESLDKSSESHQRHGRSAGGAARAQARFEQSLAKTVAQIDPIAGAMARYVEQAAMLDRALAAGALTQQRHDALVRAAADDYRETVDVVGRYIEGLQQEVDHLGMGARERDQARATLEAENAARRIGIDLTAEQVRQIRELAGQRYDLNIQQRAEDAASFADEISRAIKNSMDEAADAFANFVVGGKASFSDFADSILRDITRIAIRASLLRPLENWFNGFFGGATGGGAAPSIGGLVGSVVGGIAGAFAGGGSPATMSGADFARLNVIPSAAGNVFAGGNVVPFARGGIVQRASVMPLALMGEAGPEAVMPLARDASGRLGVRGGGGVTVNINVSTPDVASFRASRGQIAAEMSAALTQASRYR